MVAFLITLILGYSFDSAFLPMKNVIIQPIKNNTNNTFAIPIDAPAIDVNPSKPATRARIRNVNDHLSIRHLLIF